MADPAATMPAPLLLDAQEAAALLATSSRHVYELAARGAIPHLKLGRYVRFRRASLEAWIAAAEVVPEPMRQRAGR